ncbi:MAG: ParB/RepB/Spo0J family partition protein [Bacteroidales bacterium]|nr:ParB/RepB/Spo0J family partition protein [Bacteroidales bacterium]
MAAKKTTGLGRGLGSILSDAQVAHEIQSSANITAAISNIPLNLIDTNPFQPRKEFDEEALDELAQSIRQQGIISPITVRATDDGRYQLIAGERRFRASQRVGLTEIPAYIRIATNAQMMEMALVENIQRENLNAMEIAFSYNALIDECHLTHEQLSERVGKNRSTITNYLRLLALPAETQLALSTDQISMAHARALASIDDMDSHLMILHEIVSRQLSVRDTEKLVQNAKKSPAKKTSAANKSLPESYSQQKDRLHERLQSEIEIRRSKRGKGTLTIHFNNDSDFERIMKIINQ